MRKLIAFIIGIFSVSISYSQNGEKYSSSGNDIGNAIGVYDQFTAGNAPLYNGKSYVFYTFRMKGTPYFADKRFSNGWVSYQGKKYDSVQLLYDLVRNELVILSADRNLAIVLHNEMVDSFYVCQNKFVNLEEDAKEHQMHAGYYNMLHDGKIQLFAKRTKLMSEIIEGNFVLKEFSSRALFYIQKNGSYYPVTRSKDVFHVLSDKKNELRRKMRKSPVNWKRKTFENSLIEAVTLYDQIDQ